MAQSTEHLEFFVPGTPVQQGSKRYIGNGRMIEDAKNLKPWRTDVREKAEKLVDQSDNPLWDAPLSIRITFGFVRPKSHFGTGKNADRLKPSAPVYMVKKPDVDKLTRAILDALTGVVFKDDQQVVDLLGSKAYWDRPGVQITVARLPMPLVGQHWLSTSQNGRS